MNENSRNNIFTSKQTKNKVPSNIFRAFQVGTKVWSMFCKAKVNGAFSAGKNKEQGVVLGLYTV